MTDPPTLKGRLTRERILRCARLTFGRDGYVAARMSDVAEESGLSLGGLYRYFSCKEDLFVDVVDQVHEDLFAASGGTGIRLARRPYAEMLEANRRFFSHYNENRKVLRAFVEASAVDSRFQRKWDEMRERHIERFMHSYAACETRRAGSLAELRQIVEALTCMIDQCAYVWFGQGNDASTETIEETARTVTDVWYRALFVP